GGVVPQGPGILNISLAYAVQGKPLDHSDAAYHLLCHVIRQALRTVGIVAHTGAVEGSFCDGRYNLAVGLGADTRKIAGTAQLWRRWTNGGDRNKQVVLVHALLLTHVDVEAVTGLANRYEAALGSDK